MTVGDAAGGPAGGEGVENVVGRSDALGDVRKRLGSLRETRAGEEFEAEGAAFGRSLGVGERGAAVELGEAKLGVDFADALLEIGRDGVIDLAELRKEAEALGGEGDPEFGGIAIDPPGGGVVGCVESGADRRGEDRGGALRAKDRSGGAVALASTGPGVIKEADGDVDGDNGAVAGGVEEVSEGEDQLRLGGVIGILTHDEPAGPAAVGAGNRERGGHGGRMSLAVEYRPVDTEDVPGLNREIVLLDGNFAAALADAGEVIAIGQSFFDAGGECGRVSGRSKPTGFSGADHVRDPSGVECDNGGAASHGLKHRLPEGFSCGRTQQEVQRRVKEPEEEVVLNPSENANVEVVEAERAVADGEDSHTVAKRKLPNRSGKERETFLGIGQVIGNESEHQAVALDAQGFSRSLVDDRREATGVEAKWHNGAFEPFGGFAGQELRLYPLRRHDESEPLGGNVRENLLLGSPDVPVPGECVAGLFRFVRRMMPEA